MIIDSLNIDITINSPNQEHLHKFLSKSFIALNNITTS